MRPCRESAPREPELGQAPLLESETGGGTGGIGTRWLRNFFRSSSWESANWGISPGRAGSGGVVKYGCFNASMALMRFRQSNLRNSLNREIAAGFRLLHR